jgi:hypothetical protein
MKYIDAHHNSEVLEHSLENCRNVSVGDQLPRGADRFVETALGDLHSSGEEPAGEHADIVSLLHDRLCRTVRLCGKFRLVNLPVEPFQTLATRDEF